MCRKFTWLVLVVLVTGCGRDYRVSGFESYVDSFKAAAKTVGHELTINDLIIEFGKPASENADATCYQGAGTPRIAVDRSRWEKMEEMKRTALLFHEMGHCVLERRHKEGIAEKGCPSSVMYPYTLSNDCFTEYKIQYETELFSET